MSAISSILPISDADFVRGRATSPGLEDGFQVEHALSVLAVPSVIAKEFERDQVREKIAHLAHGVA